MRGVGGGLNLRLDGQELLAAFLERIGVLLPVLARIENAFAVEGFFLNSAGLKRSQAILAGLARSLGGLSRGLLALVGGLFRGVQLIGLRLLGVVVFCQADGALRLIQMAERALRDVLIRALVNWTGRLGPEW